MANEVFIGGIKSGKEPTKLSQLKKGDYFTFPGKNKVYIYNGKDRAYDKWGKYVGYAFTYQLYDDINEFRQTRADREIVFI